MRGTLVDPDFAVARRMVGELNRAHGLRLSLRARCAGGFQCGAWILADPYGRRAVLKYRGEGAGARVTRLAPIIDRLRDAGYPTPPWLAAGVTADGSCYHVQEFVAGAPATPLTAATVPALIEVLERQGGLDPHPVRDWSGYVTDTVFDHRNAGPRQVLRGLGPPGQALIDHFDGVLAASDPVGLPGGDMVHGDFNTCNILRRDGAVSGVIDIEALGSGTRVIDYAHLIREAYVEGYGRDVIGQLHQAARDIAGPAVLARCAAATAFGIVGFKLRYQPERVRQTLARLHRMADDLAGSGVNPRCRLYRL